MEFNTLLDAVLDEAGMSHLGFATRVNQAGRARGLHLRYDNTAVLRWLKGQRPRGQVPEVICAVLSDHLGRAITPDDIGVGRPGTASRPTASDPLAGFVERAPALWRSDGRVRTMQMATGMEAIGPVWEWENPPHDRDVSRRGSIPVVMDDVAVLVSARTHYEQMYRKAGGVATRARIVQFLNAETAPLLRGSYDDYTGRELHRAVGALVAIVGICSYDSDRQGFAQRYFHQALRLAKASGDRGFGGYVIALLVNQCLYMRDYRQAVAFAQAGIRTAGAHISPALATDLYAMQARAFAKVGDHPSAHQCMTEAETAAGRIRREEEPAETGYVEPGLVEAQLAEVLMSLGDTAPAQRYAAEAVRAQAHDRGRAHRLATLTTCELRAGEGEAAAATAMRMLRTVQGMESNRLRDRLTSLRRSLARNGGAAAAAAADEIDATLRIPL